MAVSLVTVTGHLETLIGTTPLLGRLWFKLPRADWLSSGEIFVPEYIEVIAAADGSFSQELQASSDYLGSGTYSVLLLYRDAVTGKDKEFLLSSFVLPSGGPHLLTTLLVAGVIPTVPVDVLAAAMAYIVEANAAADLSKAWAESPTAPATPGTKSSKAWAEEAQASAGAAADDAIATGADAAATAADRVQTGLDRLATGVDATSTAADRVQTGLDRIQTVADRVQTGLDRTAVDADRTAVAADRSTVAADKATTIAAKDAALLAFANFEDVYLGPYPTDPTLDNDGSALEVGDLYYDTTNNVMKVWLGAAWGAAYVSAAGVLLVANNLNDLANASTALTNLGLSADAKTLVTSANFAAMRTALGLGTAATTAATAYATAAQGVKADDALPTASKATAPQAVAGTDDTKYMTPLKQREGLNATGTAPIYACRAWVNFNGSGVVSILGSGNVSSILDNGVGDYTINIATALPSANYGFSLACRNEVVAGDTAINIKQGTTPTSSSLRISCSRVNSGQQDPSFVSVVLVN